MLRWGSSLRDKFSVHSGPVNCIGISRRMKSDLRNPMSNLALCAVNTQPLVSSLSASSAARGAIPLRS